MIAVFLVYSAATGQAQQIKIYVSLLVLLLYQHVLGIMHIEKQQLLVIMELRQLQLMMQKMFFIM